MSTNFIPGSGSSLWIQNLVHGLSGLTIRAKNSVFCDSSPFQKIEVFDTYSYSMILCLGGSVVLTELDSDSYHEMIVHPAMMMHKKPERVCIIGGGDGGCFCCTPKPRTCRNDGSHRISYQSGSGHRACISDPHVFW